MYNWTNLKLIEWTADYFTKHNVPNPRLDAELLLAHTLNKKRIDLYLLFDKVVAEGELAIFKGYIQRRAKREPLQYIIGTVDFCGVTIKVRQGVLIPRPETELLVEKVLKTYQLKNSPTQELILDLCTGSGAIVAALANKLTNAHFVGIDISGPALEIAKENTKPWQDRIQLLHGDLFDPLNTKFAFFDVIVSNPPYVSEQEFEKLQPEIKNFEPRDALVAGEDGLAITKKIIDDAHKYLKSGGLLIMEIGDKQSEIVRDLIVKSGHYTAPELIKDYSGIDRIIWTNLSFTAVKN